MSEQGSPEQPIHNTHSVPLETRVPQTLQGMLDTNTAIVKENEGNKEFTTRADYWKTQIAVLTEGLQKGEITAEQFNETLGTLLAEKEMAEELDPLTDIYNRRAFDRRFTAAIASAQRNNRPVSVAFIDLDRFKQINDTYGHKTGDHVLHQTGGYLKNFIRQEDILGRYGGEEFVLLLPDTTEEGALTLTARLREGMPASVEETLEGVGVVIDRSITPSIGVAEARITKENSVEEIKQQVLREADERVYRAKESGRNRVVGSQRVISDDTPI